MKTIFILSLIYLLVSCSEDKGNDLPEEKPIAYSKDKSIELFKEFTEEEKEEIDNFLMRHADWDLKSTRTGLLYSIYVEGEGETIKSGQTAIVRYEISGLDGEVYYQSDSLATDNFKVDKSDIESGIHQGIKFLNKGSRGKFIIPSHLAHGLIGDLNKIPPLTAVIYDIELIDIK